MSGKSNKEYIGISVHKDVHDELKLFSMRIKASMSSTISFLLDHYKRTSMLPELIDELVNEIKLLKEEIKELKSKICSQDH